MNKMYDIPDTLDDAVDIIMKYFLDMKEKDQISKIEDSDKLIKYHMTLGQFIRNQFGLWTGNDKLIEDTGCTDPDEASSVIIYRIWENLRSKKPE